MTILTDGIEEPFEWNTASDADACFLVGFLDLDAADRLEEQKIGLVVHEDQNVVMIFAQL